MPTRAQARGEDRRTAELRRAEEALRRAEQEVQKRLLFADRMVSMGTLAAAVAHEINNPLSYILANLEFALEDLSAGDPPPASRLAEARQAVEEASHGARRVLEIVRDLRTFSRPDEETRGPIDPRPVLESSLHMAHREIRQRARLTRDLGEVPRVLANEARLGQVFLNLLLNAAQAIERGGVEQNEIRVATSTDDRGRAVISVRDTGQGMAPEVERRIFEPFFTTKPIGVGTGLGLPICRGIVAALGGELLVSTRPGQGSEFQVVLPPAAAEAARPAPAPPEPVGRRGRVLVVDDEPMIGRAIRRTLEAEHEVSFAGGGRAALQEIEAGARYDAIVCDLLMPDVTGMDLHAALARLAPDQAERMVFLTGGACTEAARQFLARVPAPRMEKPFAPALLRRVVRRLLLSPLAP